MKASVDERSDAEVAAVLAADRERVGEWRLASEPEDDRLRPVDRDFDGRAAGRDVDFGALFRSIERDPMRRGYLTP